MPLFKEIALKEQQEGQQIFEKGQVIRTVSISEADAKWWNERQKDFHREYKPLTKKELAEHIENAKAERKIEVTEKPEEDEGKEAEQGSMEVEKPKKGFPAKK